MKGQFVNNLVKKTASLTLIATASVLLCLPALAQTNTNDGTDRMQNSEQGNDTSVPRNTSPEVNREQNRPGAGSDSDTRQNYTDESDNNNRMMQNRTGSQNSPSTNTNSNSDKKNNTTNYDSGDTGAVRGMW